MEVADPAMFVAGLIGAVAGWFDALGLMAWPLGLCAVAVAAIMLERVFFFITLSFRWRAYKADTSARIAGMKDFPKAMRDDVASQILLDAQASYFMGISLLRTISVISPLLGLLGTILGVISAFKVIAARTGPVSPNLIADGLWEAMLTTAAGLLIALPAILAAYVVRYSGEHLLRSLGRELNRLSLDYEMAKYEMAR